MLRLEVVVFVCKCVAVSVVVVVAVVVAVVVVVVVDVVVVDDVRSVFVVVGTVVVVVQVMLPHDWVLIKVGQGLPEPTRGVTTLLVRDCTSDLQEVVHGVKSLHVLTMQLTGQAMLLQILLEESSFSPQT
jgi:hypothetical protein